MANIFYSIPSFWTDSQPITRIVPLTNSKTIHWRIFNSKKYSPIISYLQPLRFEFCSIFSDQGIILAVSIQIKRKFGLQFIFFNCGKELTFMKSNSFIIGSLFNKPSETSPAFKSSNPTIRIFVTKQVKNIQLTAHWRANSVAIKRIYETFTIINCQKVNVNSW